ncbi:MAG: hypothetical protein CMP23_09795 [Rickettsiales bacterium]|nr:hypothetical protein [Rickettsiales bacterium]|tara:strand:- start:49 stop:420 length:372 start_codon:yes stop_codon:yes gene_type:complete
MRWIVLSITLLLFGCGKEPAVHLSTADHAKYPRPLNLDEVVSGSMHRSLLDCYRGLSSTAVGSVELGASGSHGLLDVELRSGSGEQALDRCALDTLKGGRLMREVGDTNEHIGFVVTVRFAQE